MIVLTATPAQYQALNGYQNGVSVLQFVKDCNDNWIVAPDVLDDPAFADIHDQLAELEEIEFCPVEED